MRSLRPKQAGKFDVSQTPLRYSILHDVACFENKELKSGFFEFDFLRDEALI